MAIEVAERHASLLGALRAELGDQAGEQFAAAAQRLAEDFGEVTATAVEAAYEAVREESRAGGTVEFIRSPREELPSLYRPGHMRRRLDQLIETNRRYGHPFGLAVFDTSGPDTKERVDSEMALAVVSAALRDSIRIVDEAFRLEEEAICVLAPNLRTVEGMQMCERLLGQLDELERAGGCGSRSPRASSPVPTTAPTPISSSTKPMRRCGGRGRWASRWESAASSSPAEQPRPRFSESRNTPQKSLDGFARSLTVLRNLPITDVNL